MNTNNIYDVQGRLATIDGVGSDTGVKPQHWYVSEKEGNPITPTTPKVIPVLLHVD